MLAVIAPYHLKGERGRPPIGLERMLRVYFLQLWYALADGALEDALHDSQALQRFARIELDAEGVPDATPRRAVLDQESAAGARPGNAPDQERPAVVFRDESAHRRGPGQQTGAHHGRHGGNVADVTQTAERLHGEETQVHADAGSIGVEKRPEIVALARQIDWQIACKRGVIKVLAEGAQKATIQAAEKAKAVVRAFVEHPFHLLKNIFRHRKVRYRGLAKNGAATLHAVWTGQRADRRAAGHGVKKPGRAPPRGMEKGGERPDRTRTGR